MVNQMKLPNKPFVPFDEYLEMRNESDQLLEYIDGIVYMSPSPSVNHQRISMRLSGWLWNLLDGKECEVLAAPFDVVLSDEENNQKVVIPDLSVICDPSGFDEQRYVGVPTLIIEIVSPSNQAHDLVFKLNLYQKYKVKEYWIINPLVNRVIVYSLNKDDQYELIAAEQTGIIQSIAIPEFTLDVEKVFE